MRLKTEEHSRYDCCLWDVKPEFTHSLFKCCDSLLDDEKQIQKEHEIIWSLLNLSDQRKQANLESKFKLHTHQSPR